MDDIPMARGRSRRSFRLSKRVRFGSRYAHGIVGDLMQQVKTLLILCPCGFGLAPRGRAAAAVGSSTRRDWFW